MTNILHNGTCYNCGNFGFGKKSQYCRNVNVDPRHLGYPVASNIWRLYYTINAYVLSTILNYRHLGDGRSAGKRLKRGKRILHQQFARTAPMKMHRSLDLRSSPYLRHSRGWNSLCWSKNLACILLFPSLITWAFHVKYDVKWTWKIKVKSVCYKWNL